MIMEMAMHIRDLPAQVQMAQVMAMAMGPHRRETSRMSTEAEEELMVPAIRMARMAEQTHTTRTILMEQEVKAHIRMVVALSVTATIKVKAMVVNKVEITTTLTRPMAEDEHLMSREPLMS